VISLAIGFCIGLYFATTVVQWIQSPLEGALKTDYTQEALEYVKTKLPERWRNDEAMQKLVIEQELLPELIYVSPGWMLTQLREQYPDALGKVELPQAQPGPDKTQSATSAGAIQVVPMLIFKPLSEDERIKLRAFNVQEGFVILIKAALLVGAIISAPFVFYFLWSFVAAGLYPHEKHYVHLFLPASLALFAAGAALAFLFVFPPVLGFFFGINKSMGQALEPRATEWMSFVLLLPLGFGVAFQLPLVMLFLERIHVFTVSAYLSKWRIAVLGMAVAAMVLSPGGDPYSMLMMLVPLIGLYFGGIALCRWLPAGRGRTTKSKPKVEEYAEAGRD
jgi:sec-independent protein translocase protein TatC